MKSTIQGLLVGGMATMAVAAGLIGCSSDAEQNAEQKEGVGVLGLPLASYGPSGTRYRLRDAQFQIQGPSTNHGTVIYDPGKTVTVSSEDNPDADSITLSVEQGQHIVTLQPGWRLERVDASGAETVEATLLSSNDSYVWISPRSTTWSEFRFGIGERSLWLNGKLNIDIRVVEDPNDPCSFGGGYGYGYGYSGGPGGCNDGRGGAAGAGGGSSNSAAGAGGTTG